jgi:hypothetical protein
MEGPFVPAEDDAFSRTCADPNLPGHARRSCVLLAPLQRQQLAQPSSSAAVERDVAARLHFELVQ